MGPVLGGRALMKYTSNFNIVFHGNSLTEGHGGATIPTGAMPYQVQHSLPVNNLVTCQNYGVGGQQWSGMFTSGTGASIDALYDPAKINILFAWEGHNTLAGGTKTAQQAIDDATTYCAQRLGANPGWHLILITVFPAYYQSWSDATAAARNALFDQYNTMLLSQWRAMGAKALVDVRAPGSLFNIPDYNKTTFMALQAAGYSVWSPNDAEGVISGAVGQNQWVHLSDIGYTQVAQMVNAVLKRLPAR